MMEQTNKTETEQLYDDMTKLETDEEQTQAEAAQTKEDAQDDEEILTEEQLEIEREIESYQSKIEKLDAKLSEFKNVHIDAMKRAQMKEAHYSDEQIERYAKFTDGETLEEIKQSVLNLTLEIPPKADNFADPSLMNGAKAKPRTIDKAEIGRNAIKRVLHKIRL